ncbi:MAG TPA: Na+/H+ antiporter subunit E [Bdellovibrionales bacterium]|nr:MAG: cation:proton antiporter [Bdellovibrionales bacterium GWB1_52_6]OFZ03844.1 MAG: cation:proton antiporter [Bdellovibrionales bacterium GWA1_52_35]OFZ38669.1 MAG: cation:proton antiporter [Bdellovibrionales bacterium GWC1_52_8]HAR43939.1 Na+/H+ antiporter subunit E [Bdellovibrionales bacterium]HCM39721.1 Na+/H+ antiporter subunit E [Bdellovibrionales bacterium]
MILFIWNLFLAFFWAAITGELSLSTLSFGFFIGYCVLLASSRALGSTHYFRKSRLLVYFIVFVIFELTKSSFRLAFDIITPQHRMRPGLIRIPLEAKTDLEITMLANLISLTPGTLTLDVSEDRKYLYMHAMYIYGKNIESVRRHIKSDFEHRILELLR